MDDQMSTRSVLICGLLFISLCNALFSLLYFMCNPIAYLILSLTLRMLLALGESAVVISGYSQAGGQGGAKHQGEEVERRDDSNILS